MDENALIRDAKKRRDIERSARQWVVLLHSGKANDASRRMFAAWLRADPAHAAAYRDCEQLMEDVGHISQNMPARPRPAARPQRSFAWAGPMAAAFLAAACLATVGLFASKALVGADHPVVETQIAEIREVVLPDGSRVTLGARSRITTHFTENLRLVSLVEGEAFFDVAPNKARPFYVQAGDRLVRVVGTRFDVKQSADEVQVSVAEGKVEVMKGRDAQLTERNRPVLAKSVLKAGDQVAAQIGREDLEWSAIAPDKAAPWRSGWLSYEDASLAEIISDANRYSLQQIQLASDDLGDIRVTASFGSENVSQFIEGLEASHEIDADRTDPGRIVLHKRY